MKKITIIGCFLFAISASAQNTKWSEQLATTAINIWPDSFVLEGDKAAKWRYKQGVILKGIEATWNATGDAEMV